MIDALQRVAVGEEALNSSVSARLLRRMTERNASGGTPTENLTATGAPSARTGGERHEQPSKSERNLGITTGTAKAHVERVIGKLGAADRTQAAVRGIASRPGDTINERVLRQALD